MPEQTRLSTASELIAFMQIELKKLSSAVKSAIEIKAEKSINPNSLDKLVSRATDQLVDRVAVPTKPHKPSKRSLKSLTNLPDKTLLVMKRCAKYTKRFANKHQFLHMLLNLRNLIKTADNTCAEIAELKCLGRIYNGFLRMLLPNQAQAKYFLDTCESRLLRADDIAFNKTNLPVSTHDIAILEWVSRAYRYCAFQILKQGTSVSITPTKPKILPCYIEDIEARGEQFNLPDKGTRVSQEQYGLPNQISNHALRYIYKVPLKPPRVRYPDKTPPLNIPYDELMPSPEFIKHAKQNPAYVAHFSESTETSEQRRLARTVIAPVRGRHAHDTFTVFYETTDSGSTSSSPRSESDQANQALRAMSVSASASGTTTPEALTPIGTPPKNGGSTPMLLSPESCDDPQSVEGTPYRP